MTTVHHTKLAPVAWAATTSQAGAGPDNLATEGLARPWLATAAGANAVTITLAAPATIQSLLLHDVNFASATVEKSVDGVAWTAAGVLTPAANDAGRMRGLLVVAGAGLLALRIHIAAGAPLDGATSWRIGAAYLFGASTALPVAPRIGYSVKTRRAVIGEELANNQVPLARTGYDADVIEMVYERKYGESLAALVERAKAGTVALAMDLVDWPEQVWPVRYVDRESTENYFRVHKAQRTIAVREVV